MKPESSALNGQGRKSLSRGQYACPRTTWSPFSGGRVKRLRGQWFRVVVSAYTLLFSLCAHPSFAKDIRVPEDEPTIQMGIDHASAGDRVLVAPGTYFEAVHFDSKDISLIGTEGATATIINASHTGGTVVTFSRDESRAASIDGFTLTGGLKRGEGANGAGGGILVSSSSPTILNNIIESNVADSGGGIAVVEGAAPYIHHNIIRSNFGGGGSGILNQEAGNVPIEANEILDNGQEIYDAGILSVGTGQPTILRNLIRNNVGGGIIVRGSAHVLGNLVTNNIGPAGISIVAYDREIIVDVVNNTVADNRGASQLDIDAKWKSSIEVSNNIITGMYPRTVSCKIKKGAIVTFTDNLAFRQGRAGKKGNCDLSVGGLIINDPLFVGGSGKKQYRLQSASPAIDAGSDEAASRIKRDLAGKPRIQGVAVDLGAYEFPAD